MKINTVVQYGVLLAFAAALVACQGAVPTAPAGTPRPTRPPNSVSISIVTNNTKAEWLGKVTDQFNASRARTTAGHQIVVEIIPEESPDPTVRKLVAGELQPTLWSPSDLSWVEQVKSQSEVVNEPCPPIAYIPTGFAMWRPMAQALGWPDKPIGWKQIIELAADPKGWGRYGHPEWGQFTFGHSHPEYSSTGFNLLASLAYAAAGKTKGLTPADVKSQAVKDAFRAVGKNTYRYGTSTTALLNPMQRRGPSYLHAAMASETAVLYPFAHQQAIDFALVFIFPSEGTFWMDNPTCILNGPWVAAEQREAGTIYRDYLLSPAAQDIAVDIGLRPAAPGIGIRCPICLDAGTDPRISPQTVPPLENVSADTHNAIIDVFKETKKNASVVLVLDKSGSMAGEKVTNAVAATNNFVTRLAPADSVKLYVYNENVSQLGPSGAVSTAGAEISQALSGIYGGGNTALIDAVCLAARDVESARRQDRAAGVARLYGVVLLTDGMENASTQKDVTACLPTGEEVDGVKIFTIAYGKDADTKLLKQIADRTNGKAFAGDPATIDQVYLAISAEQ